MADISIQNGGLPTIRRAVTASLAPLPEMTANAPVLSGDQLADGVAKSDRTYTFASGSPTNIAKIKETYQKALGRTPSDLEVERALNRADARGIDYAVKLIETGTEAAVLKFEDSAKKLLEQTAKKLEGQKQLDPEAYAKAGSPGRVAYYCDLLMSGQTPAMVAKKMESRLILENAGQATDTPPRPQEGAGMPTPPPIAAPPRPSLRLGILEKKNEPAPEKSAWEVGTKAIQGLAFSSVGDPHETTGDGLRFDNMKRGEFVKLQSVSGDFVLQTRQEPWVKNKFVTVNTAAALKMGKDTVTYDGKTNAITVNGKVQEIKKGSQFKLPDGGLVKRLSNGSLEITSPKGDSVRIDNGGSYINVTGTLSSQRKDGEVRGSLGSFDNDTSSANDTLGRSGNEIIKNLNVFIEEWRVQPSERLFNPGDATGELDPGGVATAEQLAEKHFMLKDIDNDGFLSGNEVTSSLRSIDLDGDGKVSKKEFVDANKAANNLSEPQATPFNFDRIADILRNKKSAAEEEAKVEEKRRARLKGL